MSDLGSVYIGKVRLMILVHRLRQVDISIAVQELQDTQSTHREKALGHF